MSWRHVWIKIVFQDENHSTVLKRRKRTDSEQTTGETAQRNKKSKTMHDGGSNLMDIDIHKDRFENSSSNAGEE